MDDLQRQIDRLAPLALLGEMTALLAHEYNNLLTPLLGYAAAGEASDDPEFQRKALQRCLGAAQQAQRVSASILGLTRQHQSLSQMFHMEHSDERAPVMESIESAIRIVGRDFLKDGITLEIDAKGAACAGIAPAALEHIVLNLVMNSRKVLIDRGGGTLTVKFRERASGGRAWVVIKIIDDGGGMSKDDLLRTLGPSARIRSDDGTAVECEFLRDRRGSRRTRSGGRRWEDVGSFSGGYGLIFCRRMAEAAGGAMWARSELGRGTTMAVIIPAAKAEAEPLRKVA